MFWTILLLIAGAGLIVLAIWASSEYEEELAAFLGVAALACILIGLGLLFSGKKEPSVTNTKTEVIVDTTKTSVSNIDTTKEEKDRWHDNKEWME